MLAVDLFHVTPPSAVVKSTDASPRPLAIGLSVGLGVWARCAFAGRGEAEMLLAQEYRALASRTFACEARDRCQRMIASAPPRLKRAKQRHLRPQRGLGVASTRGSNRTKKASLKTDDINTIRTMCRMCRMRRLCIDTSCSLQSSALHLRVQSLACSRWPSRRPTTAPHASSCPLRSGLKRAAGGLLSVLAISSVRWPFCPVFIR